MSLRTRQQQGQRRRRRRSCKLATANKEKGKTSIFVLGVKALNLHCQKVVVMIKQGPEKQKGELSKPSFTNLPTISLCQNTYLQWPRFSANPLLKFPILKPPVLKTPVL